MSQDLNDLNIIPYSNPPIVIKRTDEGYFLGDKIQDDSFSTINLILTLVLLIFILILSFFSVIFSQIFWFCILSIIFALIGSHSSRLLIRAWFFLLPGELIVSQYPLHLGSSYRGKFRRRLKGNRKFPANGSVKIKLCCIERVGYSNGTDTIIEAAMIEEKLVRSQVIMSGLNQITCQFDLQIPAHLPPSFEAQNNQIRWVVVVDQNMPGIVDIDSNYTLLVER